MKMRLIALATAAVAAISAKSVAFAASLAVTSPLSAELLDDVKTNSGEINDGNKKQAKLADQEPALTGNPLWVIPLATLSETRERPLFTPTRRAPPPVSARIAAPPPSHSAPKSVEPERPRLTLVGTIVGSTEGFGLFIDSTTKAVIRLKTGASYQGWTLHAVREREADLEKNYLRTTLSLPAHEDKGANGPRGSIQPSGKFSNLAKKN